MSASYRLVWLGSTGGGVLSKLASHHFVQRCTHEVVSDRPCGFLDVALRFGLKAVMLSSSDGTEFSDALLGRYGQNEKVLFLSFYTRLLKGPFVARSNGRIFNCHPSLLPSFKGMHGFEDTVASSSLFIGCTLHQVDEGMDTGRSLIQAALPLDRTLPLAVNRHRVFLIQYYSTLQFIKWIHEDRLHIDEHGRASIDALKYRPAIFSPNLDDDFFDFTAVENELHF